jgi:hypothetical protein
MQLWHNPREVQEILIGLALIASMPVAGSSTARQSGHELDAHKAGHRRWDGDRLRGCLKRSSGREELARSAMAAKP